MEKFNREKGLWTSPGDEIAWQIVNFADLLSRLWYR
jgi:hypothetical protein